MTGMTTNNSTPAYQHNGHPVTAEAFYAIACDPRRSVTVQACAGAGKTWMLVSRILRALLEGGQGRADKAPLQPHEILAITFTKKAAGEMRQRLNEWLAEFANASPEKLITELKARGFSEQKGGMRTADAANALKNLYRTVLEAGRPVQIRTFHSWFASLLRTAPLALLQDLNLPSVYELLEDDTDAIRQVWPRFFETLTQDATLLADFTATVEAHGRFQTLRALASALSKRVEFALADAHGVVDVSVQTADQLFPALAGLAALADALAPGGVYRAEFDAAAANLGRASAVSFAAMGSKLEQALTAGDFDAAMSALLTAQGTPRKFSEKVPNIDQVRVAQDQAITLLSARAQTQAWAHQQRMARLTRVLLTAFTALKRERGWIDMNDVERAAQAMLAHPELSGWLQQRLDANIRHLLIDEFQDTSPLQWQALFAWLSSYAGSGSGEAPRVFIVGDPKQSIYRFRRAEPQVFLAAQAYVCEGLQGDLLSCDHTRRNATQVVDAVNTVMLAAQAVGDYADFRAHTTDSKFTGAVLSLPAIATDAGKASDDHADTTNWRDSLSTPRETPEETRRTLECRQAAAWLANRMVVEAGNPLEPQQIMVLARKRAALTLMQDELRRLHIPALQPEKNQLGDAPEVKDIVALLDALLSPTNDLALAQALKSPLFGYDDGDLIGLALLGREAKKGGNTAPSWFSLLQKAEHGVRDWHALSAQLIQWQGWLATLPPHDALHAIYHHGDVLARFAAAAPVAARERVIVNLRSLLAAALEFDGGRYATPYALVRALKGGRVKAPTTANAHAVQLLTVHGAKGLEAPLVMLLDTDGTPAKAETMGVLVDWPGEAKAPTRFTFLASETRPPLCNATALAAEQAARKREELNALYVAMTRARHTLVLSSATPARPDAGSWWARVQSLTEAVNVEAVRVDPAEVTPAPAEPSEFSSKVFLLPELPHTKALQTLTAMTAIESIASKKPDDTEARIGQAMHRLLEWLPLASALPADLWTSTQIAAVALAFDLSPAQTAQARHSAQAIREGDAAWVWDVNLIAWQANEAPLNIAGQQRRIDRLVQRSDTQTWWVLDYKSTADPLRDAEYRAQLHGYRSAVQKNTPGQSVKAAFLTPQGRLIELIELNEH